jgi:ketosteroid isomerase-like protein
MSQENVEIVRRCYGMWDNRDFSSIPEIAHPEFVLDVTRNVFNPGVHRGVDGFARFVEQIDEVWENFDIEPEEFIDAGEHVVTAVRISGKGHGSGAGAEMRLFNIWTLRDGKVLRITGGYRDRAEVLEAAGLSE